MKHFIPSLTLFLLFTYLSAHASHTEKQLTFGEALQKQYITLSAASKGYFMGQISMEVRNKTQQTLTLTLTPGRMLLSRDSTVQDYIVTSKVSLQLTPYEARPVRPYVMSLQSSKLSAPAGMPYEFGPMVDDEHLVRIAGFISQYNYQSSTSQSAVWSVSERDPVTNVYGPDTLIVSQLAQLVSDGTGIWLSAFDLTPRPHTITQIQSSMNVIVPRVLVDASLSAYDSQGNLLKTYFTGRRFAPGFNHIIVGLHHTLGPDATIYLRLEESGETVTEKPVTVDDMPLELQRLKGQAEIEYELQENASALIGLFDDKDRLYYLMNESLPLPSGKHTRLFGADAYLPVDVDYFLKIKVNDQTIAERPFHEEEFARQFPSKTFKGSFKINLGEPVKDASIMVQDIDGEIMQVIHKKATISKGEHQYNFSFTHNKGPEARFWVKLRDQYNLILTRFCINCTEEEKKLDQLKKGNPNP